jgi:hypothetical protein
MYRTRIVTCLVALLAFAALAVSGVPALAAGAGDDLRVVEAAERQDWDAVRALVDASAGVTGTQPDGATATEKLLTYALGRGVEYYDHPWIRRIVRQAEADDYRWSSLILGIVESTPFQMRKAREQ